MFNINDVNSYQIKFKEAQKTSVLLKANINDTYNRILQLSNENQILKQECSKFKKEKVDMYLKTLEPCDSILLFEENMDFSIQKYFVSKLHTYVLKYAAVFVKDKDGYRFLLFDHENALNYLNKLKDHFIVKGGGNKEAIQGSVIASEEQIRKIMEEENEL